MQVELDIQPVKGYAYPIESKLNSTDPAGNHCVACDAELNGFVSIGPYSRQELCLCRRCHGIAISRIEDKPDPIVEGLTPVPADLYDNEAHGHDN